MIAELEREARRATRGTSFFVSIKSTPTTARRRYEEAVISLGHQAERWKEQSPPIQLRPAPPTTITSGASKNVNFATHNSSTNEYHQQTNSACSRSSSVLNYSDTEEAFYAEKSQYYTLFPPSIARDSPPKEKPPFHQVLNLPVNLVLRGTPFIPESAFPLRNAGFFYNRQYTRIKQLDRPRLSDLPNGSY